MCKYTPMLLLSGPSYPKPVVLLTKPLAIVDLLVLIIPVMETARSFTLPMT